MYLVRRYGFQLNGMLALFAVVGIVLMIDGGNFRALGFNSRSSNFSTPKGDITPYASKPESIFSSSTRNTTQCTRRTNIAFLKVHKCGSTTMSNILHRFALRNNLNVVLPDKNGEEFWVLGGLDQNTHKKVIPVAKGEEYNILAVDTVYNKHIYEQLIPNNPFFLAIFREPVERYISYMFYNYITRAILNLKMKISPYIFHDYNIGKPPILDDFKFNGNMLNVFSFTEQMDNDFDMIMVTEYFDQSLILLKQKLCWTFQDIIYITSNKNLANTGYAVSPSDRQNLISRFKNDSIFYEYFKSKLFKEMSKFGARFLEELHQFQIILKLVKDYCTFVKKGDKSLVIPESTWNQPFNVDPYECYIMQLKEFPLVRILQERQHKLYRERTTKY